MRRFVGLLTVVTAVSLFFGNVLAPSRAAECLCATSRQTNGWCPVHEFGYVGGIEVRSRWLYEFIDAHGHELDLSTFTCPTCRIAIATNGFCEIHRIGFVNKLAYFSLLTYELGKGEARSRASITCPACRKNSETYGWCAKSRLGMVGPFAIRNRQDFDRTVGALKIFLIANEASRRCHDCAGAIMTDSECPICKIAYKGGKAVGVP